MALEIDARLLDLPTGGYAESEADAAFRAQLRDFAREYCPVEIRRQVAAGEKLTRAVYSRWQRRLHAQGWAAPGWPREHGGTGWTLRQRMIFEEVMADEDCPPLYHHGLGHIGPVIMRFGTPDQKAEFLPRIVDASDWWCQGYSEPGAGSDLASLRTRAERDGDGYVINGQKIWTSHAHEADRIYLLARTSREGRKQEGISLFLVDMDSAGISHRPIHTIDGWHHVNEVFFENVRVPAARLLGPEGGGWTCAKYLLERERLPPASVARLMRQWRGLARLLAQHRDAARDYAGLDRELLSLAARIKSAREMLASAIDAMMRQEPLGARPSALKLACSHIAQDISRIALMVHGPVGAARFLDQAQRAGAEGLAVQNYLFARSKTIAGGTTEVQLNVIARALFGV